MVLVLALAWGFNWGVFTRISVLELSPWGSRFLSVGLGAAFLFLVAAVTGRSVRIPRSQWHHVIIAGLLNVAAFNIFNSIAVMTGAVSRAVVIAYSMPIWAALMARVFLGERFNATRLTALVLCVAGLTTLIWPLLEHGVPVSAIYAWGCALTWAAGTVYMKWAKLESEPMALAAWQILVGWALIAIGTLTIEGPPNVMALHWPTLVALAYNSFIGLGFAYSLWFAIMERLSATTASLASLLVPVVGIIAASVFLGERPTIPDIAGFALIFAAAACVLLVPNSRPVKMPE